LIRWKNSNIKTCSIEYVLQEEFEDTKVVIRIRKSKKDTTHWSKEKGQTTIYKTKD
jgi:hypothetical protein